MTAGSVHQGPPGPLEMEGPPDHQIPLEEAHQEVVAHLVPLETQTQVHQAHLEALDLWDHQDPLKEEAHLNTQAHKAPLDAEVTPDWDLEYKQQGYQL